MTMTYSWEKKYNPWDVEPDFFDDVLNEELELENAKANGDVSLESLIEDEDIEEIELDEEF